LRPCVRRTPGADALRERGRPRVRLRGLVRRLCPAPAGRQPAGRRGYRTDPARLHEAHGVRALRARPATKPRAAPPLARLPPPEGGVFQAAAFRTWTLSVASQLNSGSLRPKWP